MVKSIENTKFFLVKIKLIEQKTKYVHSNMQSLK